MSGTTAEAASPRDGDALRVAAFETERLRVFKVELNINRHFRATRLLFLAYWKDADRPHLLATFQVYRETAFTPRGEWWADWIETLCTWRREGIATELRNGVEAYLGEEVDRYAATDEGAAFLDSLNS